LLYKSAAGTVLASCGLRHSAVSVWNNLPDDIICNITVIILIQKFTIQKIDATMSKSLGLLHGCNYKNKQRYKDQRLAVWCIMVLKQVITVSKP